MFALDADGRKGLHMPQIAILDATAGQMDDGAAQVACGGGQGALVVGGAGSWGR